MNKSKQILGCFMLVLSSVVLVLSRVVLVLSRVVLVLSRVALVLSCDICYTNLISSYRMRVRESCGKIHFSY